MLVVSRPRTSLATSPDTPGRGLAPPCPLVGGARLELLGRLANQLVPMGLGVALLAKSSRRLRPSRGFGRKRSTPDEEGTERSPGPWAPPELGEEGSIDEGFEEAEKEYGQDEDYDDTWAFWAEQEKPTIGMGKKSREKVPEPLPDPLPSLRPKSPVTETDLVVAGDAPEKAAGDAEEEDQDFDEAYAKTPPTMMDINGRRIEVPMMDTYEELAEHLKFEPFLKAALARKGFSRLTPVQQCTIPLLTEGRDVLASAHTGSGKTAAFLLPILVQLHQALKLVPGALVAAHYKTRDGSRSAKPILGRVKGKTGGLVAIVFDVATGLSHRQLVPPEWVVSAPEPAQLAPWKGPARPVALVLVPTRELSDQVHSEARELAIYSPLRTVTLSGTTGMRSQFRDLAHGADLLVATPGRLVEALHRGVVRLDDVRHLVLDEVDRMLEMDFGGQLEEICVQGGMPTSSAGRQTSFWSATIPPSVRKLAEALIGRACVWVNCGGANSSVPSTVKHVFVDARPLHRSLRAFEPGAEVITRKGRRCILEFQVGKRWRARFTDGDIIQRRMLSKGELFPTKMSNAAVIEDKYEMLRKLLGSYEFRKAKVIVFCRRRESATKVFQFLKEKFQRVVICHGGMMQAFRTRSLQALRDGDADILVATDIAARGLDIPSISHIVNFELPLVIDEFVHRCGRTGRIGHRGTAVTFVTGRENIFKAVRRLMLKQDQQLPEWFSLEGMALAWRPKSYQVPFTQRPPGLGRDATTEERFALLEKRRAREQRYGIDIMKKAAAVERGEVEDERESAPAFTL
mmetsp:Transcript_69247/g.150707  ORF Transcript_69247/g.150707 Transcript_69247/m.150707 type:complete len:799 (-) Transcript_69247:112-2508(-)